MSRTVLGFSLAIGLALLCAPIAGSQSPPPSSSGGTLTASFDNPELGHMDFTITGADLKLKATNPLSYEGTSTGTTITLSGHMNLTEAKGYKTYLSLGAQIGEAKWHWPATGGSEEVSGPRTVSESFNLTFKVGSSKIYDKWVSAGVTMQLCGGVCSGYTVGFMITLKKPSSPPAKPPAPPAKPPSPSEPVDWPTVHAYSVAAPWPLRPGTYAWLPYTVKDASGKAKVHGTLYEGGAPVFEWGTKYFVAADGRKLQWKIHLSTSLKGPLRYCLWAVNPRGKESVLAPKSSCAWLSLLVDVKRVSNGCGGEGWDTLVWVENYFGNVHTYKDSNRSPLADSYTVDFTDACDLHDAGYGGMTVYDKLNNRTIDFRTWTRKMVDDKFWRDMKKICAKIPASATVARKKCEGVGGPASIGSEWLYNKVRYWGSHFFDADLTRPGHQASGHRNNS